MTDAIEDKWDAATAIRHMVDMLATTDKAIDEVVIVYVDDDHKQALEKALADARAAGTEIKTKEVLFKPLSDFITAAPEGTSDPAS